ncbi:MAG: hypothetical protein NTU54_02060 [Candidatus Omnitrophica bacterium]|nr:hypothetical protein [Candidatus Omnitrophota bacterium]
MKKEKFISKIIFISALLIPFAQTLLSGCLKDKAEKNIKVIKANAETIIPVIKEKPLAVKEWELVWGDLWNNEAAEFKREGISDAKIVEQLNPIAAERVSKRLNMGKDKVRQIVDDYYTALNQPKAK